jgi:hypothetical protein
VGPATSRLGKADRLPPGHLDQDWETQPAAPETSIGKDPASPHGSRRRLWATCGWRDGNAQTNKACLCLGGLRVLPCSQIDSAPQELAERAAGEYSGLAKVYHAARGNARRAMPGGRGQASPPTDGLAACGQRDAREGWSRTTGREEMICDACKHRCICEAQARGWKQHSQTGHHAGDLEHMCRRTGEGTWKSVRYGATAQGVRLGHRSESARPADQHRRSTPRRAHCRRASAMLLQLAGGPDLFLSGIVVVASVVGRAGCRLAKGSRPVIGRPRPFPDADATPRRQPKSCSREWRMSWVWQLKRGKRTETALLRPSRFFLGLAVAV